MLSKTNSPSSIKRLIRLTTWHEIPSLAAMEVNDKGYYIGACEMEAGEDSQVLAVCFYNDGEGLAAVYGFGSAPLEFARHAHAITGAPTHKLYRAAIGPDPVLPDWVIQEMEKDKARSAQAKKALESIPPGPPLSILASVESLRDWIRTLKKQTA